jgi:hypothetical protein
MKIWPGPHNRRTFEKVSDASYFSQSRASSLGKGRQVIVGWAGSGGLTLCPFDDRLPRLKPMAPPRNGATNRKPNENAPLPRAKKRAGENEVLD